MGPGCGRQPWMERGVVVPQGSWRRRERAAVAALRCRIPLFGHLGCCCCQVASVVFDSVRPHRRKPTRLLRPWDSPGKYFQKKCLAIISPVTPAKIYCCIVIIFVLIALNVVLLSNCVAVRSIKPDSHILYVPCPKGWIGFGRKCFYFSEDSKNWTFSQTFCTSREAVLAQFETEEELNFLKSHKGPFDHWIGLSRESSHHAWKWTDNSTYNTSFGMTGDGERGYLNDLGVSSARSYTERKWICSKQIISPCP